MAICTRCCLLTSLKIVDIFTNLFAVGMIVYALWLQKKWNESVAELPPTAYLPRPWYNTLFFSFFFLLYSLLLTVFSQSFLGSFFACSD